MNTRKIRLTLNADLCKGVGALVDIDFNYENLEFDLLINERTVLEYSIEPARNNNLIFTYKNDEEEDGEDRNLIIEKIELSDSNSNFHLLSIEEICTSLGIDFEDRVKNMSLESSTQIDNFVWVSINFNENTKHRYWFDYPIRIYSNQIWTLPVVFDK